jgi:dihydroorotase
MHEGAQSVRWGLRGIPRAAEDVMVARDLLLAELTGARYHVAHISTRNAVAMVDYARRHGPAGDCEATPHHFALHRRGHGAVRQQLQDEAAAALAPRPRRGGRGPGRGAISAIATDHAPHPGSEKMQEFERCPFGIIGLETAAPSRSRL